MPEEQTQETKSTHLAKVELVDRLRLIKDNQRTLNTVTETQRAMNQLHLQLAQAQASNMAKPIANYPDDGVGNISIDSPTPVTNTVNNHGISPMTAIGIALAAGIPATLLAGILFFQKSNGGEKPVGTTGPAVVLPATNPSVVPAVPPVVPGFELQRRPRGSTAPWETVK